MALAALACTRNRARPESQPSARAIVSTPARSISPPVEDEAAELINPLRALSPYADTAAGLQTMFADLARATIDNDHDQVERMEEQLRLDDERFALVFTFEGHRQLHAAVVPSARERLEEKFTRLRALGSGAAVTVLSATGEDLADGSSHGFDARIATVRTLLRPTVRYFRVMVRGTGGESVVFEPVAFAGGRWVWLAEPWTAVSAVLPVTTPTSPRTH